MKLNKELQEQLKNFFKSLEGNDIKPWMKYWGGSVEEYFGLLLSKRDKAWEEKSERYEELSNLVKLFIKQYPHLKSWLDEMIGPCGIKMC